MANVIGNVMPLFTIFDLLRISLGKGCSTMVAQLPILAVLAFYAAFRVATLLDSTSLSALRRGPHMAQMGFHHCFKT